MRVDEPLQIVGDGHVGRHGQPAPTAGSHRGCGRLDVGFGARRAHDVGAGLGEGDRGRGPDALARTGDDRDPTVEPELIEDHGRNANGPVSPALRSVAR